MIERWLSRTVWWLRGRLPCGHRHTGPSAATRCVFTQANTVLADELNRQQPRPETGDRPASAKHHNVTNRIGGVLVVARPDVHAGWWNQRKREWACRRSTGHCWHADGLVDWWCCMCAGETDGMPAQHCRYCLAEDDGPTGAGGRL